MCEFSFPVQIHMDHLKYSRSEAEVAQLRPNEAILNQINLDPGGIAVTARALSQLPGILVACFPAVLAFASKVASILFSGTA